MNKCPKCGGTSGFCTKGVVWQYYTCTGETNGYDFGSEGKMATCLDCGKQIKLATILRDRPKYRKGDTVYAVVKNSQFQLEVVEATIAYMDDSTVRLERWKTSLTADGWEFPREALDREVFAEENLAVGALFRMLGKEKEMR